LILFAVDFLWNQLVLPRLLKHLLAMDDLVGGIEVGFHQENRPKFSYERTPKHFL
jgi:hypothetical protein